MTIIIILVVIGFCAYEVYKNTGLSIIYQLINTITNTAQAAGQAAKAK
jgi:hypothetical protein